MKLWCIFLLFTVVCTQTSGSTFRERVSASAANILQDLLDKAKATIEDLKEKLAYVTEQLEELKKQLQEDIKYVLDKSSVEFQKCVDETEKIIDEWKKKAIAAGVDIKECYIENEKELHHLPEELQEREVSCISNEVDSGKQLIKDSELQINEVFQSIKKIAGVLEACSGMEAASAFDCVKDVMTHLTDLAFRLKKLVENVTKIATFVGGIQARLEACAALQVAAIAVDAGKIAIDVAKCAANKIEHKPKP